jgi:hypothetical protein
MLYAHGPVVAVFFFSSIDTVHGKTLAIIPGKNGFPHFPEQKKNHRQEVFFFLRSTQETGLT